MHTKDTKEIGTGVLLSVTSGKLLCDSFAKVQEAADFLIGEPTWTHMFASESFANRLANELKRQHPWTADEDKVFADYPDLTDVPRDQAGSVITEWLVDHVYPKHGATVLIEPEPEHVHVPFGTGLENLGRAR